jgi:hypothetical protein
MIIKAELSATRLVRRVFLAALACEAVLLLLDLLVGRRGALGYPPLDQLFDLTRESSLGNFFSSLQALAVALVLYLIRRRVALEGPAARWRRRGWTLLAFLFLYLGVDDGVMLHERIGSFATHLGGAGFHGAEAAFGSYSWQLVLGPPLAAAGLFMLLFLSRELERRERLLFFMGIACYVVALGLDHIEGRTGALVPLVPFLRMNIDTVQHLVQLVEELLEMLGTTLFLTSFLGKLVAGADRIELELTRPANFAARSDDCRPPRP